MFIRKCLYINLFFLVCYKIFSQTTSTLAIDTFILNDTLSVLNLSKSFIIESTIDVRIKEKKVEIKNFNFSKSKLFITIPDTIDKKIVTVEYQYLKGVIPSLIGPRWKSLPSLSDTSKLNKNNITDKKEYFYNTNNFYSSGSFFRNINMSPYGAR